MVNLDDTRHCPIGPECESCGRLDELAVVTGNTPAGILCMTLCDDCEVAGMDPIFTPAEQTARVLAHGQHLGGDGAPMTGRATSHNPGKVEGEGNPRPGWLTRTSEATEQPLAD